MKKDRNHYGEKGKISSVYFRTIVSLTLCTILVFAVLCIVYYQRMSSSIIAEESESLYFRAEGIVVGFQSLQENNADQIKTLTPLDKQFLISSSISNSCSTWIVEKDGSILFYTDIPDPAIAQLERNDASFLMTMTQMRGLTNSTDGGVVTGTENGLFSDPKNTWLSASYPLNDSGQYLIIHTSVDVEQQTMWMLSNGLALPIAISFTIALLLFTLMARSIVRPIRLLSDAAKKVTHGDLTARIRISELEKESPVRFLIADELSEMVMTVNHMIERLETQEKDRRVFVSSIAHDLRTPLTSIKGFMSAMLDGTIPPDRFEHYMQIVNKEVDRIQTLTLSMTEASTLGQEESMKMEPFDVNELIRATVTNLENMLLEKKLGVQIETYADESGHLTAIGDRAAIMRVIYNLLTNAIKFTPQNGVIAIASEYHVRGNLIKVIVEDSGPGIPSDKRKRIFDSFYKIDESRTNPGSGLGLYICKEILRAHNQIISVGSSRVLGGASFSFTLTGARKAGQ